MTSEAGVFWLPSEPDNRVPGHLVLPDKGAPTLELHGPLTPSKKVVSQNPETGELVMDRTEEPMDLLIYGFLEDSPRLVTLVDCMNLGGKDVLFGLVPFEQPKFQARNMVRGAHISGRDETFTAVRLRVSDIDTWASLPSFKREESPDDEVVIRMQRTNIPPVETSKGAKLSLVEQIGSSWGSLVESRIARSVWLQAESFGALTLRQIDRDFVSPIASYLSFALGAYSPLTAVHVKAGDKWLEVRHGGMTPGSPDRVQLGDVLLPLGVAGLDTLSGYLDVYEKAGPAAPVIANLLRHGSNPNIETQVLELTTVAEGIHRRLFPEDVRMSEEEAVRLHGLVAAAITDEDKRHQQIVNGSISHLEEASYSQRLKRLVAEVADAMPGACGKANRWVSTVYEARNSFAHRKEGFLDNELIDEFYSVSQSLRWVLMGVLLLQSGVSAATLAARLRRNQQYDLFLKSMRSSLPSVYGD
jgi:hypothetical protein